MCLDANGLGQLPLKSISKFMMVPKSSKDIQGYFESAKTNVKEMVRKKEREREKNVE